MSHLELFVSPTNLFSGLERTYVKAIYVILGVPFDVTSTYRTGARFGPTAIRQASLNIETFSFRSGIDIEDLRLHDLGDLHVSSDTAETLERLAAVTEDVLKSRKIPIFIGGEHTITYGIAKGLGKKVEDTAIVSFDAHLDVRDEYMGLRMSHTTVMRRTNEDLKPARIIEVGTRAVCREELAYAKEAGIEFITTQQIRKQGDNRIAGRLRKELEKFKRIYVSIDMDVLDPAYVPAAQNPEADGLEMANLLELLASVCDERAVGCDVLEIAPEYDQGISAIQAAKVIFEVLCQIEKSRRT